MARHFRLTFEVAVTDEESLKYFATEEYQHVADFDANSVEGVAARVVSNESINNVDSESMGLAMVFVSAELLDGTPVVCAPSTTAIEVVEVGEGFIKVRDRKGELREVKADKVTRLEEVTAAKVGDHGYLRDWGPNYLGLRLE